MKKLINLYWFSGTGNSLILAKEFKNYINSLDTSQVNLVPLEKVNPKNIDLGSTIGIITPVAMQGTYPIVWNFINELPVTDKKTEVFLIDTLGKYSGGILGPIKSILNKKGYTPLGAIEIIMPSNFYRSNKAGTEEFELINNSKGQIHKFCDSLLNERSTWKDIPIYSHIVSRISRSKILYSLFRKIIPIGIDSEKCISCQTCVKICPVNNWISHKGSKVPKSNKTCILCQRCVGFCPTNAIKIRKKDVIQYKAIELKELLTELKLNEK